MSTVKKKSFNELIQQSEIPVLVDFYADWCGPCQTLSPIVEQVARELQGKVKTIKVNVDNNQVAALNYQVRSIPTLILFYKGEILWRRAGLMTKRELLSLLNNAISQN